MSAEIIEFDSDGDVQLRVGPGPSESQVIFTVCSRALSRASPIFDEMLYGEIGKMEFEAGPLSKGIRLIELPHDDPAQMAILLYIVHSLFTHVPVVLSVDQLYELTALAHKYGATAALRPWTAKWTKPRLETGDGDDERLLKVMGIYWALGCREDFFFTAQSFVTEAKGIPRMRLNSLQIPPDVMGERDKMPNAVRRRAVPN